MRIELVIALIIVLIFKSSNSKEDCPRCEPRQQCLSSLTQKDCAAGKFIEPQSSLCGCCPGCRGGSTTKCSAIKKCAPGLKCLIGQCVLNKATCAYTYHLTHLRELPTCEVDGTFAAVQCKGNRLTGRCFCYSETGARIFGWSWWRKAKDMTCACSRQKLKLNKGGHVDNTLHCDQMGNFEPLQCNDGICWCADPKTGEVIKGTRAVPQAMWTFLPCYDIAKMGPQYLRQCESAAYAQHLMKKALFARGTTDVEFNNIHCDFDGAYGTYSTLNGVAYCQWRDGTKLAPFQTPSNKISKMNCNCARDQKLFAEEGIVHRLSCSENGNYNPNQDINGKSFCVDSDGFAVSQAKQTVDIPDCSKYLYYEAK